jgi:hypothetical protein
MRSRDSEVYCDLLFGFGYSDFIFDTAEKWVQRTISSSLAGTTKTSLVGTTKTPTRLSICYLRRRSTLRLAQSPVLN